MTANSHIPVLQEAVLDFLQPRPGAIYLDGTLGAGGHTETILKASNPSGRVLALDRDASALALARARLQPFSDRVIYVHGTFADFDQHLKAHGIDRVAGMLLDLGFSSMQIDQVDRGFSFSGDGPLDMRMDRSTGLTARELIAESSEHELVAILREFGEERYSKRIAENLKQAIENDRLHTTAELADLVSRCIPAKSKRGQRIHPATRTFQALRIAVNGELDQLAQFLDKFQDFLEPHGRCAIISFHSLEDRLVKHRFRDLAWSSSLPAALAKKAGERVHPICERVTRRVVVADDSEIAINPRARSAKLRVCERTPHELG